jgi:lysozyme
MPYPKTMTTQVQGRNLIKSFEKLSQKAYKLEGEKEYTIGYGHKGAEVKSTDYWTIPKCEQMFLIDVKKHEQFKNQVTVPLNQNQFDALSSFSYNLGGLYSNGTQTTLLKMLNKGDYKGASNQMMRFVYPIQFKVGLTRRRLAEKKLFDTPIKAIAPIKTKANEQAVNKANAQKQADLKNQLALQDKLTAQDRREEIADQNAIKKAQLTRNAQQVNIAKAKAKANQIARENAIKLAKQNALRREQLNAIALKNAHNTNNPIPNTKSNPTDSKAKVQPKPLRDISQAKVLKSGLSLIGLIALVFVMNNAELEKTELE